MVFEHLNEVIADFTISLDYDAIIQPELYEIGVSKIPNLYFNNQHILGERIRPGVLKIDKKEYEEIKISVCNKVLCEGEFIDELVVKGTTSLNELEKTIEIMNHTNISKIDHNLFNKLFQQMTDVSAMTSFNWLIPLEQMKEFFLSTLGSEVGIETFLRIAIPDVLPHYSLLELKTLELAKKFFGGNSIDLEYFKDYYGCLFNFGMRDSQMENDDIILDKITKIFNECNKDVREIDKRIDNINYTKKLSIINKNRSIQNILRKISGGTLRGLQANELLRYCRILEFINEEEERRHIFQMRFQRIIKKLIKHYKLNIEYTTINEIKSGLWRS
jgi:hypothetical protein